MAQSRIVEKEQQSAPTDFGSVFRAAPGLYLLLLPDAPKYTIITASDAFGKATFTNCEALVGRGIFDAFLNSNDKNNATRLANLRASLEHVLRELKTHEMAVHKHHIDLPEGGVEEKHWSAHNTPVFDDDGNVQYIIYRIEDVTEKHRIDTERNMFFEVATDLLVQASLDGFFKKVNTAWETVTGWTEKELTSSPWLSFVHPDDREATIEMGNAIMRGKKSDKFVNRYRCKNGSYRWFEWKAKIDAASKLMYGAATDITEQRAIEIALRESEQFTRSVLDSSSDCMKVIDLKGRLLSMNVMGCKQMEIDDFSVCVNKPWVSFWQGDGQTLAEHALAQARAGKIGQFEGFCPTMKGVPKWWEVIITPIYNTWGEISQLLSVSRDITARKKQETINIEARENAESANLAKSEFLANMSHEIRTPMNAVIGLAAILGKSEGLTQKQKEYVRTLQLSADSLLSLINDLLDISKIEARSIELEHIPFNIAQLLNEVISMMAMRAKEKGLDFAAKGECNKEHILVGDPMRLRQIILNLCSNAIKFTKNGSVYVNVVYYPSEIAGVENVSITVVDTGIGIPLEKQETVFGKFTQVDSSIAREYGGTGLGLAITKTLTEIMGGTITLESVLGEGSTFTVTLPLMVGDNAEKYPVVEATKEIKSAKSEHCILLVEDYAANVLVAGTYLETFGYSYDVVDNGYEAVEKAKMGNYLAILMDVQMHGINGFEATKLIRIHEKKEGKPRIPIIGITAHALMGDRERCIAAEMDDYLSKPYNPDELKEKLASYLISIDS